MLLGSTEDGERAFGPGEILEKAPGTAHDYRAGSERDLVIVNYHHGLEPA